MRTRPRERGKIGNIETQICRVMICEGRLYTTSELARAIYAHPGWDQNFRFREKGEKVPELKSWHYLAIRKAAPTFCDCIGRSTAKGRPRLWKLRGDYFHQVRENKRGTRQSAKSLAATKTQQG